MSSQYIYRFNAVKCDDETVVALKFIESMKHVSSDDQKLLDKLKDDSVLYVTMISGKEYPISMRRLMNHLNVRVFSPDEVRKGIYERWSQIIGN